LRCGLRVVSFGVNLGDENVGLVGKIGGNSLPNRCKGFAVCTVLAMAKSKIDMVTYGHTREQ